MSVNKKILTTLIFFWITAAVWASGTGAGLRIIAPSSSLVVLYNDDAQQQVTRSSSEFGIIDDEHIVLEINGLVETNIDRSEIAGYENAGSYKGIEGGPAGTVKKYVIVFQYLNRGNTSEDVRVSASVTGGENRWWKEEEGIKTLQEDAIGEYRITLNVQNPLALEQVSLTTLAKLITANNVVSYNAFSGAVGLYQGSAQANVQYGGTDNIKNTFNFEAEGATLEYIYKIATITAPAGYGSPGDAPVPGSKIKLTTAVKNTSTAVATGVKIRDKIPNNCHFYPTDTPVLTGAADNNYVWVGGLTNTVGSGSEIGWDDIKISPNATVVLEYTVTIN